METVSYHQGFRDYIESEGFDSRIMLGIIGMMPLFTCVRVISSKRVHQAST